MKRSEWLRETFAKRTEPKTLERDSYELIAILTAELEEAKAEIEWLNNLRHKTAVQWRDLVMREAYQVHQLSTQRPCACGKDTLQGCMEKTDPNYCD